MRQAIIIALIIAGFGNVGAYGQIPTHSILNNSVTNLHAEGDVLWVGPHLNVTRDGGHSWYVADADSLVGLRNRVYSIDAEGDVIWVGLGTTRRVGTANGNEVVDLAKGFLFSEDGGTSWNYRSPLPPQDRDPTTTGILDLPEDTLITYGNVQIVALAITVPDVSPPWDIDYDPVTGNVWAANQLAGLRRSRDQGRSWQRVILPPDTTRFLSPLLGYDFPYFVQPTNVPREQFYGLNFQVFSVLADKAGTIWTGTADGVNRSTDGGESWYHFTVEDGLTGNLVISIEEQLRSSPDPVIWIATRPGYKRPGNEQYEQNYGVVVTRDSGQTFEQVLFGDPVWDFAFDDDRVYIAGNSGLHISEDDGRTFRTVRDFFDPSQPERTRLPNTAAYAVAVNSHGLWVGTEDGLFRSRNGGDTWQLFRTDVPLSPDERASLVPIEMVPRVKTYAYPNPFSLSSDRLVRIRYQTESSGSVTVRIFDFSMSLVRTLSATAQQRGEHDISWDGIDSRGTRVANGSYFYAVEIGRKTVWGKILVLE